MKLSVACICLFIASSARAQDVQTQFPEGSEQLSAEMLQRAITGKVFSVTPAKGPSWRLQYDSNGYFYVNAGTFSDSGKWSTKESSICGEGKQLKYSCNEIRLKDGFLHLKRESGEIVKLEPR